jgi:hypothetical protein
MEEERERQILMKRGVRGNCDDEKRERGRSEDERSERQL